MFRRTKSYAYFTIYGFMCACGMKKTNIERRECLTENPKMFTTRKINLILVTVNSFIPFSQLDLYVEKFGCCFVCVRGGEVFVCFLDIGLI